jgi:DNA modification methylase
MKIHCKYDELVEPKKLKVHPKNRNKHSKEQIERLAKLYEYHGIRHPIIVSKRSGYIVAGHGRKAAAHDLGMKEFPVVYQDFDTDEAEYAFIQADNAIALWAELDLSGINSDLGDLGPDFDVDMLGIKNFEIDVADKDFEADEDEVPEARPEPKVVQGEVYILGNHRLMCGDSTAITDVERLMNGEKADMVYTDPPYGISYKSPSGKGLTNRGDYAIIKGDDKPFDPSCLFSYSEKIITWGANHYANKLPNSACWLVWDKREGDAINNNSDCELAWCSDGGSARLFHHKWNGMIKASEKNEKRVHPTQKPLALHEWVFQISEAGKIILDLFGGSGSTLIACEKTNRKCFMMELDPLYCGVILDRWQKFTGKKAHREDGKPWDEIKGE